MTFIHQDEPAHTPHPIDMLERTVEENGWAFERAGRDELNLSVAGRWSDHHFSFSWREDLQSLHLSSAFDMRITEGVRRSNVADLLMYVNARLWIGHFDLWPEDGTIVFRHAMIFPGAEASENGAGLTPIWFRFTASTNTGCMPPSMLVRTATVGVPRATSAAIWRSSSCCFSCTAAMTSCGIS